MFYSRLLLSKKAPLGYVWVAAHCPKKLRKDQVKKIDVSSCVDKILVDEVPVFTHRILAYLLLGVVRIFSIKVEYLFNDCNDILNKHLEYNIGKRTHPAIGVSRTSYHSITMPKNFELDEFDLEHLEDQDIGCGNVLSREDVMLADERRKVGGACGLLYVENVTFPETHSTFYTPPRDVVLPPHMDHDHDLLTNSSHDIGNFVTSIEQLRGTNFLVEDLLSPTILDGSEKEQMRCTPFSEHLRINFQLMSHEMICDSVASPSRNRSDMVRGIENLQENGFSLEDRLDPLVLDEAEEQQIRYRPCTEDLRNCLQEPDQDSEDATVARVAHKGQVIEEQLVEHPRIELKVHEDEPLSLTRLMDIEQPAEVEKKKFVELVTLGSRKCQRRQEQMRPWPINVTPSTSVPGYSLEDRLDPLVLDEAEEQQIRYRPCTEDLRNCLQEPDQDSEDATVARVAHKGQVIEEQLVEHPRIELKVHEDEPLYLTRLMDIEQPAEVEKKKFVELVTLGSRKCQRRQEQMRPWPINVTPSTSVPGYSLEDRLDPLVLDEAEEQQIRYWPCTEDLRNCLQEPDQDSEDATVARVAHKGQVIEEHPVEHPRIELKVHKDEPLSLTRLIDIEQPAEVEKKKFVELVTSESRKCQRIQEQMRLWPINVTPNTSVREVGSHTQEVVTVQTPAPKERAKILKKRKILWDLTTVLPSKVLKRWIDDSNDILHKRRKVPHTLLHAWRANKLCHIPESLLDPLIDGISPDSGSIHHKEDNYTEPVAEVVREDYASFPCIVGVQEQITDEGSPFTERSREQTPIAPGTPVTCLNSLRSLEIRAVADSDVMESTSSHESLEQQPLELYVTFPDEETNSSEGHNLENDVYSARTRTVGMYLYNNFLKKKRREKDEVLNLVQLLTGRANKECARLFYEILVLKTLDCIDVKQDKAYDDILLRETLKLKQLAETNVVFLKDRI